MYSYMKCNLKVLLWADHHGLEVGGTHGVHSLIVDLHDTIPDLQQPLSVDDPSEQNTSYDQVIIDQFQSDTLQI